jgi:23S rRNA-/tRNA-specific pseudouridylate synthase
MILTFLFADQMPPQCTGVVEVEVELMTGRSHQIRGQLSALGFPLCGDAMYGGLTSLNDTVRDQPQDLREGHKDGYMNSEQLALQCCKCRNILMYSCPWLSGFVSNFLFCAK